VPLKKLQCPIPRRRRRIPKEKKRKSKIKAGMKKIKFILIKSSPFKMPFSTATKRKRLCPWTQIALQPSQDLRAIQSTKKLSQS